MSVTISNVQENHRALAWRYTGDGVSTSTVVNHTRFTRSIHTAKCFVTTGATKFSTRSERGGIRAAEDGTAVNATVSISGNAVTVTTSPAVGNGIVADVVVVHDQATA